MDSRKIVFKGELDTDGVTEGLQDIDKESKKTTDNMSEGFGKVDAMLGGIPSKIQGGIVALGGFIKGMGTLRGAIMATGIGALIVALGALTAAFTTSEDGQNKWAKVMGVVGSVVGNFTDLLSNLGDKLIWAFENPQQALTDFANLLKQNLYNRVEGLITLIPKLGQAISLLFEGEFKQAGKVAADAVGMVATGVESITDVAADAGKAIANMAKEAEADARSAGRVADMRAKAAKIERQLLIDRQKVEAEIQEARLNARSEDEFSAEQRIEMLREAQRMEDELLDREEAAMKLKRDAIVLENSLSRTNIDGANAEAEAQAALERVQVARLQGQRLIQKEIRRLNKQQEADAKAAEAAEQEALEATKARLEALVAANKAYYTQYDQQQQALAAVFESKEQQEIDAVARKYDEIAIYAEQHGVTMAELNEKQEAEISAIQQRYAEERAKQEAANNAAEVTQTEITTQQKLTMAANALSAITALNTAFAKGSEKDARRAFKRNKALGLASAVIQTGQAITGALTAGGNPIKLATGAQFVEAAIAAAAGAAQIATIAKTQYEGGAQSTPAASPVAASAPTGGGGGAPNINVGQFGQGFNMPAQRTYVISKEVTNAQQANQLVNEQAALL